MKNCVSVGYIKVINALFSMGCLKGEFVRQTGNWLKKEINMHFLKHTDCLLGLKAFSKVI